MASLSPVQDDTWSVSTPERVLPPLPSAHTSHVGYASPPSRHLLASSEEPLTFPGRPAPAPKAPGKPLPVTVPAGGPFTATWC